MPVLPVVQNTPIVQPLPVRKRSNIKPSDKVSIQMKDTHVSVKKAPSIADSYQVVPRLKKSMTIEKMIHIAKDEHAKKVLSSR